MSLSPQMTLRSSAPLSFLMLEAQLTAHRGAGSLALQKPRGMQAAKRATERGRMLGLQASESRGVLERREIWIVAINDSHQKGDPKRA